MSRKTKIKKEIITDTKYGSANVGRFINYVMKDGKKTIAEKIVYSAFDEMVKKAKVKDPLELFETALKNVGPTVEVRSRRVGGANYQVPREVRPERQVALAMRWILEAAKNKKGQVMRLKLSDELLAASKKEGDAVKKRENTHKMAEANKAFAHFAF